MSLLLLLIACGSCVEDDAPPPDAPAAEGLPPEPALGVPEVVTPPGVVRASEVQDISVNTDLDVWFAPSVTTFEALGAKLEAWGFVLVDGDGESWRVTPPRGRDWITRLQAVPDVARVAEALDRETFETGAFREGRAQFGPLVHSWAWREGGPVEQVTGGDAPPAPVLPSSLPDWAARCLGSAMDDLTGGVTRGVGWERALRPSPAGWVLVVQGYGGCDATGWLPLTADGDLGNLQVAGRPLAAVQPQDLYAAAETTLRSPRGSDDAWAETALALLDGAPPEVLRQVAENAATGAWQQKLLRQWADADPDNALTWARASSLPQARALLVLIDATDRRTALQDAAAPAIVVRAALTAWRPGPGEGADILARLRKSPDAATRELAWERTLDQERDACLPLVATLPSAKAADATAAWRSCPLPEVRDAALARLQVLDQAAAGALLAETLELPENVVTGVQAARLAAQLGRVDLLESFVKRRTVAREPRREALRLLIARNAPSAKALAESHARYLGAREAARLPENPATAEGEE